MIIDTHVLKLLRHVRYRTVTAPFHAICYFQKYPILSLSSVRCLSSNAGDDQQSFVVSYLINNCGLSPQSALSASKYLNFETPEKPDSLLAFLKRHGFSKAQIAKIIHTRPIALLSDPEKTFLPKIQFFLSKGFENPDVAHILSVCPEILHSSIPNRLIPSFNDLRDLLPSDEMAIRAIKRLPKLMLPYYLDYVIPNTKILKETGLPLSNIVWLLRKYPMALLTTLDHFCKIVEEVKGMRLNPTAKTFVIAIMAMRSMSKLTWKTKFDIYNKCGWSQEETLMAFGKFPWVLVYSEKKIMNMMEYYTKQMGCDSSFIAKYPYLIGLSLEKRVVPRCSVLEILLSKGLIRLPSLATALKISEKVFLHKFVAPYLKKDPNLMKLYEEKLDDAKCEIKL